MSIENDVSTKMNNEVSDHVNTETFSKSKGQLVNLSSAILDLCIDEPFLKQLNENEKNILKTIDTKFVNNQPTIDSSPTISSHISSNFTTLTQPASSDQLSSIQSASETLTASNYASISSISTENATLNHLYTSFKTHTFTNNNHNSFNSHNSNNNICSICNKVFLNKSNLMRHHKSIHLKNKLLDLNNNILTYDNKQDFEIYADKNNNHVFQMEHLLKHNIIGVDDSDDSDDDSNDERNDDQVDDFSRAKKLKSNFEEELSCKYCIKTFPSQHSLSNHMRNCEKAFECGKCHEMFETHALLSQHLYSQHELFLCWMCDKVSDSMESYADHVNFCHPSYLLDKVETSNSSQRTQPPKQQQLQQPQQPQQSQQLQQPKQTQLALSLQASPQSHQPPLPEALNKSLSSSALSIPPPLLDVTKSIRCHGPNPCLKCGKVFSTFSNLLKHVRVIHENSRFPCNLCKRVFACKEGLKSHLNKIHEKISHKCSICSMEFENQLRLAKHLSLIHNNQSSINTFQCDQCPKSFLYKTNLKRHKKLDHEGLRYSCDKCPQQFRSKSQVSEHTRVSHLGQPLQCPFCPCQFHSWGVLRDHERAVHNKHSPIVCAICGAKFNRYPSLSYHLKKEHKRRFNVAGDIIFDPHKQLQKPTTQQYDTHIQQQLFHQNHFNNMSLPIFKNEINTFETTLSQDVFAIDNNTDFKDDNDFLAFVRNLDNNVENTPNDDVKNISNNYYNQDVLAAFTYEQYGATLSQELIDLPFSQQLQPSSSSPFYPSLSSISDIYNQSAETISSIKPDGEHQYNENKLAHKMTSKGNSSTSTRHIESAPYGDAQAALNSINPFNYDEDTSPNSDNNTYSNINSNSDLLPFMPPLLPPLYEHPNSTTNTTEAIPELDDNYNFSNNLDRTTYTNPVDSFDDSKAASTSQSELLKLYESLI